MHVPWIRGRVALQAHVGVPDGTVEEEVGRNGFFGRYAHLYRKNAPVGWTRIEGPLRPRLYDAARLVRDDGLADAARRGDWLAARAAVLENEDVTIHVGALSAPMPYFLRDADCDELLFVHAGRGRVETDFGSLAVEAGDYVTLPRGTLHRLVPQAPMTLLALSVASELEVPDRGMLGQHALFDPAVIRVPTPGEGSSLEAERPSEYEVRIVREGEVTKVFYPFCPLDVVGWKGTLSATALHVRDIRPVSSDRYHLPPSAHTTFVARNVVVCTFAPRPLENGDPTAMKVPFYHSNVDFDEVLFYHAGEFFSRKGVGAGALTFHPQGIHHGPQPGALERTGRATRTEEVAVMIDTKRPLRPTAQAARVEDEQYWKSWMAR